MKREGVAAGVVVTAVAGLVQQQEQVHQQADQQQCAVQAVELMVQGQCKHHDAGENHQRDVQAHQLSRHPQWNNQRRKPEGDEDVKNIAANDTAHGNVRGVIERGLQADRHLGCAAAHCYHGQADQKWPYLQFARNVLCAAHQQLRTCNQQHQAAEQLQHAPRR